MQGIGRGSLSNTNGQALCGRESPLFESSQQRLQMAQLQAARENTNGSPASAKCTSSAIQPLAFLYPWTFLVSAAVSALPIAFSMHMDPLHPLIP